jgi:multisubunit Na+/H+ antiporter MnhG subunit
MAVIVHLLVWVGVVVELLCCVGLVTMRNAIDRLHYAGAATAVGPGLIAAAVCCEEGLFTTNGLNAVVVALMLALLGGALGVATGRAIRLRERGTLEPSAAERERGG